MKDKIINSIVNIFESLTTVQIDRLDQDFNYFRRHGISKGHAYLAYFNIASVMAYENKMNGNFDIKKHVCSL